MMQSMLMDVLRALATPNMDIRKKTLDIALDLINQHNIDEVKPAALTACHSLQACRHCLTACRQCQCSILHELMVSCTPIM